MKKNKVKTVPKSWGREVWIENNDDYCCKILTVKKNKRCSIHYHKNKKETFLVNKGCLRILCQKSKAMDYGNNWKRLSDAVKQIQNTSKPASFDLLAETGLFEEFILNEGESLTLEQFTLHTFTAYDCEYCEFIETSTHHKDSDSYRIYV